MNAEIYKAFIAVGTTEEIAESTSKAIAENDHCFNKIEMQLLLLKWMVGLSIALDLAILVNQIF